MVMTVVTMVMKVMLAKKAMKMTMVMKGMLMMLPMLMRLTSTMPGMCLGGVCTRMAWFVISSLHTGIVPNITCTNMFA